MKRELNWGAAVVAAYGLFALATTMFVVFAAQQRVDLVSADYYAEGLHQDQRAAAEENTRRLGSRVGIWRRDAGHLEVAIPGEQAASAQGQITLYRASDARADRLIALAVDAQGHQTMTLEGLARGRWTIRLAWTAAGRDFYCETPLVIE